MQLSRFLRLSSMSSNFRTRQPRAPPGECLKINVNDFNHCGAKHKCNDDDPSSDNYVGKNCIALMGNHAKCENNECVCTDDYVNIDGICVDPTDNEHCGAQEGIPGEKCGPHSTCERNECICTDGYVKVDGTCVDPNSNEHCGASEGVDGISCTENSNCVSGVCVCVDEYAMREGKCIESKVSNNYCGAKGTCDDPDMTSENYQGIKCDKSAECIDGACVCNEGLVKCGEECINPSLSNTHCGAKGDCNSEDAKSDHYQGAVCEEGLMCGDGLCRHLNGCIDNTCSLNDCHNTNEQCGMQCMNCKDYGHTKDGFCKIDIGVCEFTECNVNYHLNADKTDCIENLKEACAPVSSSDAKDCTAIEYAAKTECSEAGICTILQCQKGYHLNETKTACVENKDNACAPVDSSEAKNCNIENDALVGKCNDDGTCSIEKCRENYHFNEHKTACVVNTERECAPQNSNVTAVCADNTITGTCTRDGICDCTQNGHLLDNGSCEADTDEHCGTHDNACRADTKCDGGVCYATSCNSGTNSYLCAENHNTICRPWNTKTNFQCIDLTTHNEKCFKIVFGDQGQYSEYRNCTDNTAGRGTTGKCIYDPEHALSLSATGYTCECKDPNQNFEHPNDGNGLSYRCVDKN